MPSRRQLMQSRLDRRAERQRRRGIAFLDPHMVIGARIRVQNARDGFAGSEIPAVCSGNGFRASVPRQAEQPRRAKYRNASRTPLSGGRLDVRRRRRARPGVDHVADNQRNLKLAVHHDAVFMTAAEHVAGEINRWAESFRPRDDLDWQQQLHHGLSVHAGFISTIGTCAIWMAPASSASSWTAASFVNNQRRLGQRIVARPSTCRRSDGGRSGVVERRAVGAGSAGNCGGTIKRRPFRAAEVSSHGNPRGARASVRWLQHRPLRLSASPTRRRGSPRSSTRTSTRSR